MRASRSLSTRLASVAAAVAVAASGLVGVFAVVAPAGPAGADTTIGAVSCNLGATAGVIPINATIAGSITPNPVPAGNDFNVTGLSLNSELTSSTQTAGLGGASLTVSYTTTLTATGATPASQSVTLADSITLPNPFPVGATQPLALTGTPGSYVSDASGASTAAISISGSGSLAVTIGPLNLAGPCTGPPSVQFATASITPAVGFISTVIPNSGSIVGGSTVKLVGKNFSGASAVSIDGTPAASYQVISPTLIEAVTPAFTIPGGNPNQVGDILVTTAGGTSNPQPLDQYTFVDTTQAALVTSVSPSIGTSAGGTPVTIVGGGFNGGPGSPNCPPGTAVTSISFGSVNQPTFTVVSDTVITTTAPPGAGLVDVVIVGCDQATPSPTSPQDQYNYNPGYVLGGADGAAYSYGAVPGHAGFFGSAGALNLNAPVVGVASTPNGNGYWLAAADGGIFTYGGATFYGSMGGKALNAPIVGIAATPDGAGYWLVAADGGIFTFGDAVFYGSTGGMALNAPIVGMASSPSGNGYLLVAADGGVFAFGDAGYHGSTGGMALNAPIVGIATNPSGTGYWLAGADGGVFTYGTARFYGSLAGTALNMPVAGISGSADGGGYWLTTMDGAVFNRGNAGFFGDRAGYALNGPVVGMAPIVPIVLPT